MIDKFVKEYTELKGYNREEWGVVSDLVKDGLISMKQARDFLIRKHYIERHQQVGCMKLRAKLARDYEVSLKTVIALTTGN